MKFKELYLAGEVEFDVIHDLAQKWNFSDETCSLKDYLGLSEEEEDVWISESDEALEALLNTQKVNKGAQK